MADYFPLIARAVGALEKSNAEARRAIYERARTALIAQLRSVQPPLSESDITRERLGLEEAIRRAESDAARRARDEVLKAKVAMPPGSLPAAANLPQAKMADDATKNSETEKSATAKDAVAGPNKPDDKANASSASRAQDRDKADDSGVRQDSHKAPRDAATRSDTERSEPGTEPDDWRARDAESESGTRAASTGFFARRGARARGALESIAPDDVADMPATHGEGDGYEPVPMRVSSGRLRRVLVPVIILSLLCGLGAAAYLQRDKIVALYQSFHQATPVQTTRDTPTTPAQRPKIPDRIGQESTPGGAPGETPTAVAQRVVLFEQVPNSAEKKQSVGSVTWRTEMSSPGPKQPPVMTIKADVEIPERHLRMSWSMRRNTDAALPASHTIEIIFNGSPDFPAANVTNVPGILMDVPEQNRGVPLAGLAVKVTNGFFLVGLSSVDVDVQRNTQLLKDRPWLDIPIVYADGGRALLAMEKGTPGERVFADAFAAWAQK